MNKFHSEKAQILGTAVGGVFARVTCSQYSVHLCVMTCVLDVVRFSLVTGRGRKLVFECLSEVCSSPTA